MSGSPQSTWKPIERLNATRYILIMVVSLAITITVTRLYLELTGYPQIGNDTFHIAHALWGGLLQAIAVTLVLIYLNQWIFHLSAILAGMGIGLFVDEIGKFITQSNDYFFPLAAPIIYVSVILGVFLYLYVRREDDYDARGKMYVVLNNFKPLLDKRMSQEEYTTLRAQLDELATQSERGDIAGMAKALQQALADNPPTIAGADSGVLQKLITMAKDIEARFFGRVTIRRIMLFYFSVVGLITVVEITLLVAMLADTQNLQQYIEYGIVVDNQWVRSTYSLNWYLVLTIFSLIVGVIYLVAAIAFMRHREHFATQTAIVGLVLSLTIGHTMSFYFNQFSVMISTILLFGLLMMVLRYRDRFVDAETDG